MNKMAHKWLAMLMALLMLLSVCPLALAEELVTATEEAADTAELKDWTVMIYLCGTDLESAYSMATVNLVEIAETIPGENVNVVKTENVQNMQY